MNESLTHKQTEKLPKKLSIAHVAATTEGATWMVEQLRELRDRHGFDVTAIISGLEGGTVDKLRAEGIRFIAADFEFCSFTEIWRLPRKILTLAALLRRERFDVVQTHLFHSMVIGRIASWLADVPVRLAMIAGPFHLEAYTPRWIDGSTQWMETSLIASCEFTRTLYRGMGVAPSRIELVYYGVDEARFTPDAADVADVRSPFGWRRETPIVGMVAFFYPRLRPSRFVPPRVHGEGFKGHEYLLKAAPLILKEMSTVRFVLVGSGWGPAGDEHLREMKALCEDLGISDKVAFAGLRHDIPQVLRSFDVSVQPSVNENLGGTIESLLVGCPMVGSRVGGIPDAVVDGVTGVLAEPGDPKDLARAILSLLRNPDHARALGQAGRERMLHGFTLRDAARELGDLYTRSLKKVSRGYRLVVSCLRALLLLPVSAYLVLRLTFDMGVLAFCDPTGSPWSALFKMGRRAFTQIVWSLVGYAGLATHNALDAVLRRFGAKTPEAKNVVYLGVAQAVAVATSVGAVSVFAASLSVPDLGRLALALYAVTVVSLFAQLGLRYTAIREVALEPRARRAIHHHAVVAQWLSSGLALLLLLVFGVRLWPSELRLLLAAGLVAVTQFDCDPATWVLLGEGRVPAVAGLLTLDRVLYLAAAFAAARGTGRVRTVLLAILAANLFRKAVSWARVRASLRGLPRPQWDPRLLGHLLGDGARLGVAVLSYAAYSQATVPFFGMWAGRTELGYYSVAFSACTLLSIIPTSLTLALFPSLTSKYGGAGEDNLFDATARLNLLVVVPISMAGVLFGSELLRVWLGPSSGAPPLVPLLLAVSLVPSTLSFMHRLFFFVGNRPGAEIALNVTAFALTGLAARPLSNHGAVGVALLYLVTESCLAFAKSLINSSRVGGRLGGALFVHGAVFIGLAVGLSQLGLSLGTRLVAYVALGGVFLSLAEGIPFAAFSPLLARRKTQALKGE